MEISSLREELQKRQQFDSVQQEATLSILRTSDLLENRIARLLRTHSLTPSQYNVLRILRGEGKPMPCLEVADRMIQVAPAITRVVDQLTTRDLIGKSQAQYDRRVFLIEITPSGHELLLKIDQPMLQLHAALLGGVSASDLRILNETLGRIRGQIRKLDNS